ncbi:MAG: CHAT domain-containing protein [Bradymonadia bacterium]
MSAQLHGYVTTRPAPHQWAFSGRSLPIIRWRIEQVGELRHCAVTSKASGAVPEVLKISDVQVDGWLILGVLEPPAQLGPSELVVRCEARSQSWRVQWWPDPRALPEVKAIDALIASKAYDEAYAQAKALSTSSTHGLGVRQWGWRLRGRVFWYQQQAKRAVEEWVLGARAALAEGSTHLAVARLNAAMHASSESNRYDQSEALFRWAGRLLPKADEAGWAVVELMAGGVAARQGYLRRALRLHQSAARRLNHLNHEALWIYTQSGVLKSLIYIGDFAAARDLCDRVMGPYMQGDASPPAGAIRWPTIQAGFKTMCGWMLVRHAIHWEVTDDVVEALALLESSARQYATMGDERGVSEARMVLVSLYLWLGDLDAARHTLEACPEVDDSELYLLWGKLKIAEGRYASALVDLAHADRLARLSEEAAVYGWQARAALGEALVALGLDGQGWQAFDEAMKEIEQRSRWTAPGVDRSGFMSAHRDLVGDYLDLLTEHGDIDRAATVLASAQSTLMSSVPLNDPQRDLPSEFLSEYQQRVGALERAREVYGEALRQGQGLEPSTDVQITQARRARDIAFEDLLFWLDGHNLRASPKKLTLPGISAALDEGEVLVMLFAFRGSWHTFLIVEGEVDHALLPTPESMWSEWPEIFAEAEHVYVATGGALAAEVVHRELDPDGSPWAARVTLSYLQSPAHLLSKRVGDEHNPPVIVGDPEENLGHVGEVLPQLADSHLSDGLLLMGEEVSRDRLLDALPAAEVFVFVGHGEAACGAQGNCLRFAGGDLFELADVLSLEAGPRLALVMACHSGERRGGSMESQGLVDAFFAVGTRTLLIAEGTVDEQVALAFLRAFIDAGGLEQPASAYRAVVRAEIEGWRDFRLMGSRDPLN